MSLPTNQELLSLLPLTHEQKQRFVAEANGAIKSELEIKAAASRRAAEARLKVEHDAKEREEEEDSTSSEQYAHYVPPSTLEFDIK